MNGFISFFMLFFSDTCLFTGKERKVAKRGAKKEEKPAEHEDSSSDESVPDDGELSDEDSDFDPDEDPDRPWCICRKPHGNRYSVSIMMMSPLYPCGKLAQQGLIINSDKARSIFCICQSNYYGITASNLKSQL